MTASKTDRHERLPWLRLFVRDWLGSPVIARLTVEQEGILVRLLLNAWELPACAIPEDLVFIGNIAKTSNMELVQKVLDLCFERVEGVGFVPREPLDLAAEAARAERLRDQKRAAGLRSASERRERTGTAQPNRAPNARSNGRSAASNDNAGANDGAGEGANGRSEAVVREIGQAGRCETCGVYLPPSEHWAGAGSLLCDDCMEGDRPTAESEGQDRTDVYVRGGRTYRRGDQLPNGRFIESIDPSGIPTTTKNKPVIHTAAEVIP